MSDNPKFCEECGASIINAIKFCTNCGANLNDLQADEKEKIIEKTTKQEFLAKYKGKKILDHIDKINSNGIGNESRLYSIYKIIESKQELTDEDFEYLIECSNKFNDKKGSILKPKSAIKQTKHSNSFAERSASSIFKKVGIGIGGIFVFFLIIGIVVGISSNSNDSQSNNLISEENKVLKAFNEKNMIVTKISNALKDATFSLGEEYIVKVDAKTSKYSYDILDIVKDTQGVVNIWADDKIKTIEVASSYQSDKDSVSLAALTIGLIEEQIIPSTRWERDTNTTLLEWIGNSMEKGLNENSIIVDNKLVSYSNIIIIDEYPGLTFLIVKIDYDKNEISIKPKNELSDPTISASRSEYCEALKQWNKDYEGIEWLTEETLNEYERLC